MQTNFNCLEIEIRLASVLSSMNDETFDKIHKCLVDSKMPFDSSKSQKDHLHDLR